MTITKPTVGSTGWDVNVDQIIDAVNGSRDEVKEVARDAVGAALTAGTNIGSIVLNDAGDTITINGIADATVQELARDAIGAALVAGTNVAITVDDTGNTITINGIADATVQELARDAIGAALVAGTGISITVDDTANTITITNTSGGGGGFTQADIEEFARDAVGAALTAGTNIGSITLNDAGNTITINGIADATVQELARDAVGTALVPGTGISITVNDAGDTITVASTITQYTDALARAALAPRVTALTDGATITPNVDTTDVGTVTIAGNRTMAAPSGTPVHGQKLILRIKQDATGSRTITWNAIYRFSGGTAPTLTTTAAKTDYVGFIYNATDTKWDCLAERLNF